MVALTAATAAVSATLVYVQMPSRTAEPVRAPSDAEVRSLVLTKWRQALDEGKETFCADAESPSLCGRYWDEAGGSAAVPREQPRVVASHTAEAVRWITVCGMTGTGREYESEFVVKRSQPHGSIRIMLPVFWWTQRFRGVFVEGSEPTTTAPGGYPDLC